MELLMWRLKPAQKLPAAAAPAAPVARKRKKKKLKQHKVLLPARTRASRSMTEANVVVRNMIDPGRRAKRSAGGLSPGGAQDRGVPEDAPLVAGDPHVAQDLQDAIEETDGALSQTGTDDIEVEAEEEEADGADP